MRKVINFNAHRLGLNCGSAPIRDMLEYNGYLLSEPMCFGLGSGLHFVYHHGGSEVIDRQYRAPITVITGRTETPFVELCSVLGVKISLKRTHDKELAWEAVKELIDRDIPVACDIDVSKIHDTNPIAEKFGLSMGGHKAILIGYDTLANEAIIIENTIQEPVSIPLDVFHKIRDSAKLYPSENEWFYIDTPKETQKLSVAIKMAIQKNVQLMKNPAFSMYETNAMTSGLPGLKYWHHEISNWPNILDRKRLELSILTVHIQNTISGGGLYRKMYARFLREADDCLNESGLIEVSNLYRRIAGNWDELISLMMEAYETKEYAIFSRNQFKELTTTILKKEYKAIELLDEVIKKWN